MPFIKLGAETARASKDILNSAWLDIHAELTRRNPDDVRAQARDLNRPLRMVIFFALEDLDLQGPVSREDLTAKYAKLTAETVRGAKNILTSCEEQLQAQMLRRYPGDYRAQAAGLDRPLRTTIHYDLRDLDREGPLSVDEIYAAPHDGIPLSLKRRGRAGLDAPSVTDRIVFGVQADGSPLIHGGVGKGKSRLFPSFETWLRGGRPKGSATQSEADPAGS